MSKNEWKDELFAEDTPEEVVEETEEAAAADEGGVIAEDPFDNAFQYTQPDQPKPSNWPVIVLAVLLVLTLIVGALWGTGVLTSLFGGKDKDNTPAPFGVEDVSDAVAATCDDISVSNGAIAFFMEMEYLSSNEYANFDPTIPLKQQDATAYEKLVTSAKTQFERMVQLNASAKKNGTKLNTAAKAMVEKAVASVDVSAFHNGVTEADVREFYELYYTAWMEESRLYNSVTLTDADVEAIYNEFPADYSSCSIAGFLLYVNKDGTYKTMDEAKAAAKTLTDCKSLKAFREEAIRLLVAQGDCKDEKDAAEKFDTTYVQTGITYQADDEVAKWLFDANTKVGDTKMVTGEDSVVVYMLTEAPAPDTTLLANVRHLYLSTNGYGDATALATLKDEILAAWEAGDKTLEAFNALVMEYTADFNTLDGVFWETEASPSVGKDFTAWCFDKSRKPGDVGAVSSDYGVHILYFVGRSEKWRALVLSDAQDDALTAAVEALPEKYPLTFKDDVIAQIEL